ncbi:hypothetical protein EB093_01315 [bacterium]|nr:hypothetical protein [bacterium]
MGNPDYKIEISDQLIILRGVFRLESPNIYDELFSPIRDKLSSGESITLDIKDVTFLNSSGITALARLIITARTFEVEMSIIGNHEVPWQKKSLVSLNRLWPQLCVSLS